MSSNDIHCVCILVGLFTHTNTAFSILPPGVTCVYKWVAVNPRLLVTYATELLPADVLTIEAEHLSLKAEGCGNVWSSGIVIIENRDVIVIFVFPSVDLAPKQSTNSLKLALTVYLARLVRVLLLLYGSVPSGSLTIFADI